MNTTAVTRTEAHAPRWRVVLGVFKLRIGVLIMLTALAGVAIAPGEAPPLWQVLLMALAVLVSSASAGAFNQFVEADSDRLMRRTRQRAFASGALHAGPAWMALIVGLLAAAVAATWTWINPTSAAFLFLGAFTYAVVYTVWLKRRTWTNIVFGGLAGSFAVLTGAAAVDPSIGALPMLLALVLFLWTPPHFWAMALACKRDYQRAGVPMLPTVVSDTVSTRVILAHTVALVLLSLLPVAYGMGWIYLLCAASGGAYFVHSCWMLVRKPSVAQGWRTFAASIVQLGLLLTGAVVDALVLG